MLAGINIGVTVVSMLLNLKCTVLGSERWQMAVTIKPTPNSISYVYC